MNKFNEFKDWLDKNSTYTKETKSDIVSRLRRADKLIPITGDPIYLFMLSQCSEFNTLTVNVRSQIRRAVKIYYRFLECEETNIDE